MTLNGGLVERPLNEAMKLKARLLWRPQNVRVARAIGYLLRKLLTGNGTSQRARSMLQSTELNRVGDLECFDIRHGDSEF